MARRRKSGRRYRGGNLSALYKFATMLVICAVVIMALTLFFRVSKIDITGEDQYTEEEIIEAAGLRQGDNLILLNKFHMAQDVTAKLPYVEEIHISRRLPDTLVISLRECRLPLALVQDGSAWLISPRGKGKIVDQLTADAAADYPLLDGCSLLTPEVGGQITLSTEYASQQESLLSLLNALEKEEVFDQVDAIHLEDISCLVMDYAGRFRVEMPYGADYDYKVRYLKLAVESLEPDVTGTVQMMRDNGEVHFIED